MKENKKIDTTPFDRNKMPPKQNILGLPLIWCASYFATRKGKLRINKVRMKGLKPPYIVLGSHHAFMDFYVTPLAIFPHRANYISELEGFEAYGEWIYRQAGCLGTRKFVDDLALVKNIKRVVDDKRILVLYPEARYANVGTSSKLPASVGKLVKLLKVPVVVINMRGNYLQSPIWNINIRKDAILDATITQVFTKDELAATSLEDINIKLNEFLTYDEYAWQYETKQAITYDKRAEGIEMPLYQCPVCKTEFNMATNKADLICNKCGAKWTMSEYGQMIFHKTSLENKDENTLSNYEEFIRKTPDAFKHIPNWYEWERSQVINEINNNTYSLDTIVKIEALPNAVNFIDLGNGRLIHNKDGFLLIFKDYGDTEERTLSFSPSTMSSIHTEYNYRNTKGPCVTLSTLDNTYFLYPTEDGFNPTKIQFATEYLYELSKKKK